MDDYRLVLLNKLRDAFDECVYEFDIRSMIQIPIILIALLNFNRSYRAKIHSRWMASFHLLITAIVILCETFCIIV